MIELEARHVFGLMPSEEQLASEDFFRQVPWEGEPEPPEPEEVSAEDFLADL